MNVEEMRVLVGIETSARLYEEYNNNIYPVIPQIEFGEDKVSIPTLFLPLLHRNKLIVFDKHVLYKGYSCNYK